MCSVDPDALRQRAPKFDADIIAELIIRIMTTHAQGISPSTSTTSTTTTTTTGSGCTTTAITPVGKNSTRFEKLQCNAAKARDKTGANASTPLCSASDSNSAISKDSNNHRSKSNGIDEGRGQAILVFLSGIQAIQKVNQALRQRGLLQRLNAQVKPT